MNLKSFVAGAATMSALGVGGLANSQQVRAAVWHKGIPVVLRGNYARKQSTYPQFETLKVYSNKVIYQSQGNPQLIMRNVSYKKVGRSYALHGIVKANTTAPGARPGKETWKFHRYSNKLSSKRFDGHATWYYKNMKL